MEKRVKITEGINNYIEKLFFEYNAIQNILRYLTSQDDVKSEYLDRYFEDAKIKNVELELAKQEVSKQYQPKNMYVHKYTFDFDNCEIVYVGGEKYE